MTSKEKLRKEIEETETRVDMLTEKINKRGQRIGPANTRDDLLYETGKLKGLKTAMIILEKE